MSVMEYAQARMQARFGARPQAASWRGLDGASDLGAYLEAARGTSLRAWLPDVDPRADLHQIDSALRERFRAHVEEVARWLPPQWRPAVLGLSRLPDLPAIQHLLSGDSALAWMWRHPALQELVAGGSQADVPEFLKRYRKRARRGGAAGAGEVRAAFLAEWERLWPRADPESLRGMRSLVATILNHLERFKRANMRDAWQERAGLEHELRRLFRESALRPETAFCYLALVALDLERLRAALVRRVLWRGERGPA
jgi:hypothetical protein